MSTSFHFKQFSVQHFPHVFKVGTDSVLLGAWAHFPVQGLICDAGTGSGVLALMAAQRSAHAQIHAFDILEEAVENASLNFNNSPFASRTAAFRADLSAENLTVMQSYDYIVSNPPYFRNSLKSPSAGKNTARHQDTFPLEKLFSFAQKYLSPAGKLGLVLPSDVLEAHRKSTGFHHFFPQRICHISNKTGEKPHRVLAEFGKEIHPLAEEELCIRENNGEYTEAYKKLTADFYLHFPSASQKPVENL